jgi:hypothetical protein
MTGFRGFWVCFVNALNFIPSDIISIIFIRDEMLLSLPHTGLSMTVTDRVICIAYCDTITIQTINKHYQQNPFLDVGHADFTLLLDAGFI